MSRPVAREANAASVRGERSPGTYYGTRGGRPKSTAGAMGKPATAWQVLDRVGRRAQMLSRKRLVHVQLQLYFQRPWKLLIYGSTSP